MISIILNDNQEKKAEKMEWETLTPPPIFYYIHERADYNWLLFVKNDFILTNWLIEWVVILPSCSGFWNDIHKNVWSIYLTLIDDTFLTPPPFPPSLSSLPSPLSPIPLSFFSFLSHFPSVFSLLSSLFNWSSLHGVFSISRALGSDYHSKLEARLDEVEKEIEQNGHYNLTNEELTYGARLAWRNAPRCVNRIVWRQLEVYILVFFLFLKV